MSTNNKNIKKNGKPKSMSRRQLIKEISDTTRLKPDAVKSVLDTFSDIFIREVVINGKFNFSNCFSVDTHTRKAGKRHNVNTGTYQYFPETKVLDIRLSKKINSFNRWKQRHEYNQKHGLTVEDWRNREGPDLPK